MKQNTTTLAVLLMALVYSSCSKKQSTLNPVTTMVSATTTKHTTSHKEKKPNVIIITYKGYFTHVKGEPVCIPSDVVCYTVITIIDHSEIGLGPNGENNGNFEFTRTTEDAAELTINDPAGQQVKDVTYFKSATESDGSNYITKFNYTEL